MRFFKASGWAIGSSGNGNWKQKTELEG